MQAVSLNWRADFMQNFRVFARDIKLSHSIFALPFVGVALLLSGPLDIPVFNFLKIVVCMILARSFAMGMNRFLDRDIDAANSRTSMRALPAGSVSPRSYLIITVACGVLFIAAAFSLSELAGYLSPALLVVLAFYSLMKKLSWLTHWYLGLCLGLAPLAAEIALFGRVTTPVILVGLAVALWTAGFDLLYSLQDQDFDRQQGLHSAPAKLGHKATIWLSRVSFAMMVITLVFAGHAAGAAVFWYSGVAVVATILSIEHWLIRDAMRLGTSEKINIAFFNLNAMVSVLFLLFVAVDYYVKN
jgi:4-hydroxybenzoate polyprenyltransferase